ncbi:helix-turn-helix transcriptional regulator [Candidatus Woesearchaeota archaeon]|nr:helix-turn-helix transcriptional regulator [Candidatus Woesearchaeota archaeon]
MASKNFLLVSLEETKAKELAQIVSNDVCRRILDYLAGKEHATETAIAKDMAIALSTVHYNIRQLLQSGIVKAEEFHYSEKGREVLHYSLANRYIIIAPKAAATESLANKLKRILPVVLMVAAAGVAIQLFSSFKQATSFASKAAIQRAAESSTLAAETGQRAAQAQPNVALWFVIGAVFALAAYAAYDFLKRSQCSS